MRLENATGIRIGGQDALEAKYGGVIVWTASVGGTLADITFVGSEHVDDAGTSAAVPLHASAVQNDFALIVASADDSGNSIILPAGFTEVFNGDVPNNEVGAVKIAIGYKVLGASEPSTYTVGIGISDAYAVSCSVWRDVDVSTPQDVAFSHITLLPTGDPGLPACPSVTTVTDKCAIITIVADSRGPGSTSMNEENYYFPPAGTTEVADANIAAGTNMAGHGVGWQTQTTAGATGTIQWTCLDNNDGGFAGTLALRPATT